MVSLFFSAFIKREAVTWWMKAAKLGCWRVQELEQQPTATTAVNQGIWMLYGTVTVHSLSMFRSLESLFQLDRWVMTAIHPRGARRRFKDDQGPVAGTSYSMPHILHIYLIDGDISIVYLAIFILSPSNESFEQVNTGLGQCDDLPRMGMWLWVNTVHMLVQQCHKHMDPDGFHPNHVYMDKHGVYVWMVMVLLWFYHGFYHGKLPTTAPSLSQFYYGQFFSPRSSHLSRTSANWGSECLRICNGQICNKWQPPSRKAPWKILESTWTISEFFSRYYITIVCSHACWICWTSLADETIYKMSLTNDYSGYSHGPSPCLTSPTMTEQMMGTMIFRWFSHIFNHIWRLSCQAIHLAT